MICTSNVLRDNHFDQIVNALADNKMVIYEQLAEKGPLDSTVMILNPLVRSHFIEEDDPETYFASNLLLFYLYQLEQKFGKKWGWIEGHLKNNPLFRSYKISQRLILKLSVFLHMLLGERLLLNYRQALPFDRVSNISFFPAEGTTNKKKVSVGRKKKSRSNEKEELSFKTFVDRIEREKARLAFSITEDETAEIGSLFFNRMKFNVQKKQALSNKRFKPVTSSWSNWKLKESKVESFDEKLPDMVGPEEKKPTTNMPNYPKFLKKCSLLLSST
jgi:hypothetical protein